ncbi:helix-turn-helix domain-containing protein [Phycicoccus sp. Soil803]|uniref:helix-turn-helix domain-containing protein n=1 Tax=Phycicoccus sp. Soil803 TaxID=1736415 RepID=UPI001F2E7774|nr:helix-turn-helix domain-containing protein [Phycicoccus sp. Soil803]
MPHIDKGYLEEGRVDEPTVLIAEPHLRRLDEIAKDIGGYVSLTAPNGTLVNPSYLRQVEDFPDGYSLLEASCGSNGEGMALEEGRGVWLAPEEHYREDMWGNWCFASLVRDPLHNRVRGVIGLTFPASRVRDLDPSSTLLMLEGIASRVEREIETRISVRERALLREYLTASRRRGVAAVVATDGKHSFMNSAAMTTLQGADLAILNGYATGVLTSGAATNVEVMLAGTGVSTIEISPIALQPNQFGAVAVVRPRTGLRGRDAVVAQTSTVGAPAISESATSDPTANERLRKRLHGQSVAFERALAAAQFAIERHRSVVIIGEPGSGKRCLAEAIAAFQEYVIRIDARDAATRVAGVVEQAQHESSDASRALLLAHADELSAVQARALAAHLRSHTRTTVVLTAQASTDVVQVITDACEAMEIPVMPLRRRREDIALLANAMATDVGERRLSRKLVTTLTNADWPGNIGQLRHVVMDAAERARGIEVNEDDLCPGLHRKLTSGRLSRLEDVELAEIRRALREAGSNRRLAAEILEIGRSTLYRRMDYFRGRGFEL